MCLLRGTDQTNPKALNTIQAISILERFNELNQFIYTLGFGTSHLDANCEQYAEQYHKFGTTFTSLFFHSRCINLRTVPGAQYNTHTVPEHYSHGAQYNMHTVPEHCSHGAQYNTHTVPEHYSHSAQYNTHTVPEHYSHGAQYNTHTVPEHYSHGAQYNTHAVPEHYSLGAQYNTHSTRTLFTRCT